MKKRRIKVFLAVTFIAVLSGYLVFTYRQRPQPSYEKVVMFLRSVYPFVEVRMQRGSSLPPSVPLSDLVLGGYITPGTMRQFEGSEITFPAYGFSEAISLERASGQALISVHLQDGRQTVLMADGSIQQLPK